MDAGQPAREVNMQDVSASLEKLTQRLTRVAEHAEDAKSALDGPDAVAPGTDKNPSPQNLVGALIAGLNEAEKQLSRIERAVNTVNRRLGIVQPPEGNVRTLRG